MRKRLVLAIIISLALIFSLSFLAAAGSGTGKISIRPMGPTGKHNSATGTAPNYVPGELLVKYKTQISSAAINSFQSQLNVTELKRFKRTGIRHIQLPEGTVVEDALKNFKNNPDVEYAQPNYIYRITETIPNDTYFGSLWGLRNTGQSVDGTTGTSGADIKAPEAWDTATGNSAITVAIIDTGVDYNHPDLINNISSFLYDYVNDTDQPMDLHGHGTHLAGTIAAEGNNNRGVVGVTWSATIMPLRAANAYGDFYSGWIIAAIEDAVDQGAYIINASFGNACGYSGYDLAVYNAIVYARDNGVLFVAAAGNCGVNNDTSATPSYPASYNLDNIIAVAATDQDDILSSFSNYGATKVHVGAPGENIYSTKPSRQTIFLENFDGTGGTTWPAGWTHGGTNDTWGFSSTTYYSSPYSLAVNPAGNYLNNADAWAQSPVIDLSSSLGTTLRVVFTGKSQSPSDRLYFEVSTDGTNWTSLGYVTGDYSDGWYGLYADLGEYDNGSSTFYGRLRFVSNASTNDIGWFIDDVTITTASTDYSGTDTNYYQFMDGTSMATPHVAGLAALIWGYADTLGLSLTYLEVKDIILRSVDLKSSLTGKTVSGGRINAFKALNFCITPATPVSLTATAAAFNQINLSWTASANVTQYTLQRKLGVSGTYATVATPNGNTTSYSDTGLTASSTYYYQLLASNYGGDSGYSSEASATTPAAPPPGSGGGGGGGCFIATAAFGSPLERHVQILRDFRDRHLLNSAAGKALVNFYYEVSPPIAQTIAKNEGLRLMMRWSLMPVIGVAYLTFHWGGAATLLFLIIMVSIFVAIIWTIRRKLTMMRPKTSI